MRTSFNSSVCSIFKFPRIFKGVFFVAFTIAAIFFVYAQCDDTTSLEDSIFSSDSYMSSKKGRTEDSSVEEELTKAEIAALFSEDQIILRQTALFYADDNNKIAEYIKDFKRIIKQKELESEIAEEDQVYTKNQISVSADIEKPIQQPSVSEDTSIDISENVITTWSGETYKYKKVLDMRATAYTYTGTDLDITASGVPVQVGVVAADFSVIPMNSKVYIVSADGSWEYGYAIVGDTGVKGDVIDIFFETEDQCVNFGVRNAIVYILE